jgi:YfiH family protein
MKVKYHFFGKDCIIDRGLINRENLFQNLEKHGFTNKNLLFVNQIHSNEVFVIDNELKLHEKVNLSKVDLPKADAIVTNLKNVVIAVFTADCSPICLFDEEKSIIAIVHSGWRGAKSGIIKNSISEMKKLGAKNIKAIIGPTISQESYHITEEFFDQFLQEKEDNLKFFKTTDNKGCYFFDLPAYAVEKLKLEQVVEINNQAIDTYKNEKDFFSYRRSIKRGEGDCGRNISVIMMK